MFFGDWLLGGKNLWPLNLFHDEALKTVRLVPGYVMEYVRWADELALVLGGELFDHPSFGALWFDTLNFEDGRFALVGARVMDSADIFGAKIA